MAYMKDSTGRRLDTFEVLGALDGAAPMPLAIAPEYVASVGSYRPGWMSDDGLRIYNFQDATVRRSSNGSSWSSIYTFARQTTLVRETADGELLVCLEIGGGGSNVADPPLQVWKSSGYSFGAGNVSSAGAWTQVLTGSDGGARIDRRWCHWVHGPDVFLIEYGWKSADSQPKKAYHSADHGATWRQIFAHPFGSPSEAHSHGIAYDEHWDRVWITVGDGALNRAIYYSDDWRQAEPTWVTASAGGPNAVGIYPMRDCILFGSDDPPNGVWSYPRLGYRQMAAGHPAAVHAINATGTLTHVAGTMYRRSEDHPLLICFAPSSSPKLASVLVATKNGRDFYTIWTDSDGTYESASAIGLTACFGPTAAGKIVGDLRDDRNNYTLLRADMPTWRNSPSVYDSAGTRRRLALGADGALVVQGPLGDEPVGASSALIPGLAAGMWGIPGAGPHSGSGTYTASANNLWYTSQFSTNTPIRITAVRIGVASAGAAGTVARIGVARLGDNLQPTALMADLGTVAVDAPGIKAITGLTLDLPAGRYCALLVSDGSPSLDYVAQGEPWGHVAATFNAGIQAMFRGSASAQVAALTDPPPAWTAQNQGSSGNPRSLVQLQWVAAP